MASPNYGEESRNANSKWEACYLCGPLKIWAMLYFDSGSVEPTEGETLTGATSGDTGVVSDWSLLSGSWAGGDAAGFVYLESPTGYDYMDLLVFDDDELINGSTGGSNMLTANGDGYVQKSGCLYPQESLTEADGHKFCAEHYRFRYDKKSIDETVLESGEEDREI